MTEKTLAMRALEGKRINYTVLTYPTEMRDAEEIAQYLNLPAEEVFKTLVVLPPDNTKKALLVMLPANSQLELKKLAEAVNTKKIKMATHREAEQLTGLQVGGISPLALLNKPFIVYIDDSALLVSEVCISAGKRGLQLRLKVDDLLNIANARPIDVAVFN